jgi:hypothetical protein
MEKGLLHLFCEVNSLEHLKVWKTFGYFDPRKAQEQTTFYLAQQYPPPFTII